MPRSHRHTSLRLTTHLVLVLAIIVMGTGCNTITRSVDQIDQAVAAIDKTIDVVQHQSDAWRDQLPILEGTLTNLETQAATDAKDLLAASSNEIDRLTKDTIKLAGLTADQLISRFGAELRCNVDFAKSRVVSSLQEIKNRLTFWKKNKTLPPWPPHSVCQVTPDNIALMSGTDNSWHMSSPDNKIVGVYGYDFRSEALPAVELQDKDGKKLRDAKVDVTYGTRYQVNLNFGGEDFSLVVQGAKFVLDWPDKPEPNSITLALNRPAHIAITHYEVNPSAPRAKAEPIHASVTLTNDGGQSTNIVVSWTIGTVQPPGAAINIHLEPGETAPPINFRPYLPDTAGTFEWAILVNESVQQRGSLTVTPYEIYPKQQDIDVAHSERLEPNVADTFTDTININPDCVIDTANHPASYYGDGDPPNSRPELRWDAGMHVDIKGYPDTLWKSLRNFHGYRDGTSRVKLDSTLVGPGGDTGKSRFQATFTVYTKCGLP